MRSDLSTSDDDGGTTAEDFSVAPGSSPDGSQCLPAVPIGPGAEPPATLTQKSWVSLDAMGNLQYTSDAQGNRIPDFSFAGYGGGGVALPTVAPIGAPLMPNGGDDSAAIQAAIDAVSARQPDPKGFRGAVVLGPGTFTLAGTLSIAASGVVLRGAGSDPNAGTILHATGVARTLLTIGTGGNPQPLGKVVAHVSDAYVPVGATAFHVDSTAGLAVGMPIVVQRPDTEGWICAIGMNQIPPRPDGHPISQWQPGAGLLFDRTITAIVGNQIRIDVPLTNALESQYQTATVWPYSFPSRITQVGVESLRVVADFSDGMTNYFNSVFVTIEAVQHGWVTKVTTQGIANSLASLGGNTKWITVQDSALLDPVIPPNADPPAGFTISGQQILIQQCSVVSGGVRIHPVVTQGHVAGPNVLLDFVGTGNGSVFDIEGHQRWATGLLIDRAKLTDTQGAPSGLIALQNRGNHGSGQGWSSANSVAWNCSAKEFGVDNPPTASNWVIGGSASTPRGTGYFSFLGTTVQPASLFLAQLRARLGDAAVHAIGY
jgi:hypothetical protein